MAGSFEYITQLGVVCAHSLIMSAEMTYNRADAVAD